MRITEKALLPAHRFLFQTNPPKTALFPALTFPASVPAQAQKKQGGNEVSKPTSYGSFSAFFSPVGTEEPPGYN
jgi:hypothetical protein